MAFQPRHRFRPSLVPDPTPDEDEIFGSVETDEVFVDPGYEFATDSSGPVYPDVRKRNPRVRPRPAVPKTIAQRLRDFCWGLGGLIIAVCILSCVATVILLPAMRNAKALKDAVNILPINIEPAPHNPHYPLLRQEILRTEITESTVKKILPINADTAPMAPPAPSAPSAPHTPHETPKDEIKKLPIDIPYEDNDPVSRVSHVLSNLPEIISFELAHSISGISKLNSDLGILFSWLEHEMKNIPAEAKGLLTDQMNLILAAQVHIQRLQKVRTFDSKILREVKRISDRDDDKSKLWYKVADIVIKLHKSMARLIQGHSTGLGGPGVKNEIIELLEKRPEKGKGFSKEFATRFANAIRNNVREEEMKKKADDEEKISRCKKEFIDSIFERFEKIVHEMDTKRAELGEIKDMFGEILSEAGDGIVALQKRLDPSVMLENWIRIAEVEAKEIMKIKNSMKSKVAQCSAKWLKEHVSKKGRDEARGIWQR